MLAKFGLISPFARVQTQENDMIGVVLNVWKYIKGQLISECLFDALNFTKKQRKIWQISALESKKWSNCKIKVHYDDFDTNYM